MKSNELPKQPLKRLPSVFAIPQIPLQFTELVLGEQAFAKGAGGDFVVQCADGMIAYQLAVTVDDHAMEMTDVLRGSDLAESTYANYTFTMHWNGFNLNLPMFPY